MSLLGPTAPRGRAAVVLDVLRISVALLILIHGV